MFIRTLSTLKKFPINVSSTAWDKMAHVLDKSNNSAFLFFATGGGCNGFNYNLEVIDEEKFSVLKKEKPMPTIITNADTQLLIEPLSEMLLIGTTIDFIEEDYKKNIFESRFIFTPQKDLATSCGCGVSFSPRV